MRAASQRKERVAQGLSRRDPLCVSAAFGAWLPRLALPCRQPAVSQALGGMGRTVFANGPYRVAKRPVSQCKTGCIALQNGPCSSRGRQNPSTRAAILRSRLASAVAASVARASLSSLRRPSSCRRVRVGAGRRSRASMATASADHASSRSRSAADMCITEPWRGVNVPRVGVFCTKVKFFRSLLRQNW